MRGLILFVLVAGCGTSDVASAPEPTPTPAAAVEVEGRDEGVPEAEVRVEEAAGEPARFEFAEGRAAAELATVSSRLVQSREVVWDAPRLENDVARRRLSSMLELAAYEHGAVWTYGPPEEGEGCRVALATERVVSARCVSVWTGRDGGQSSSPPRLLHFAIEGETVRPFDADAIFVGSPSEALGQEECARRLARSPTLRGAQRRGYARQACEVHLPQAHALLREEGVELEVAWPMVLPWAEIAERVRPTGPLAWLFDRVDRPPPPADGEHDGYVVGDVLPLQELATLFRTLPPLLRTRVRVVAHAGVAGELVVVGRDALAAAGEVAAHLSLPIRRAAWTEPPMEMRAVRASAPISLLLRPWAGPGMLRMRLRQIPAGSHLTTISTTREMEAPAPPQVRVTAATETAGYADEPALESDAGCLPSAEGFLAELPEEARGEAGRRLVMATVTLRDGGASRRAALFTTGAARRSHVALYELGDECALGEPILRRELPGYLFDTHLTTTEPDAGDSLLVVGVRAGPRWEVQVYGVSDGRRLARFTPESLSEDEGDIRFDEGIPHIEAREDGDDYWPVVSSGYNAPPVRYRWRGRRLVLDEGEP